MLDFTQYVEQQSRNPQLTSLLLEISEAGRQLTRILQLGALAPETQNLALSTNIQGEEQKPLDLVGNQVLLDFCTKSKSACAIASEEMDNPIQIEGSTSPYLLLFDPLDGSSNLEINGLVGTIFSVLKLPHGKTTYSGTEDFLQPGTAQVAAGYLLYGPSTLLVVTLGDGVREFLLDQESGAYLQLNSNSIQIPPEAHEYSINASNRKYWDTPTLQFIQECEAGKTGVLGKDYNMRWIAAFVGDIHRILKRGGSYFYPQDSKDPTKIGKIRLLYEINPMAFIVEQAGGLASSGLERCLEMQPQSLHQRSGIFIGSKNEIERIEKYYQLKGTLNTFFL